ncbi:MAG: HIT family protein [Methanobacteriaceae archaeon]|jgi:diadenosine tetraphosphate (Ap4A) HIT family hydrolase|nr:HIT family protein [Candidatus Methanorudis spinitermitis]
MKRTCEYSVDSSYGDLIIETKYWEIFLAPSQRYLGTCVVSLKRDCGDLKDLNVEEWVDFGKIVKYMEIAIKKLFAPDLVNWSCLKNSVFRKDNPKPHIHWQFIPRYKDTTDFEGLKFEDSDFGYLAKPIDRNISNDVRNNLIKAIKNSLNNVF